jgi:hypothetical protein
MMPRDLVHRYNTINSTKSPASDTGNASESGLTSHVGRMRDVAFAYTSYFCNQRAVRITTLFYLRSSCKSRDWEKSTARLVRLALKVVVKTDRHFVDVILL